MNSRRGLAMLSLSLLLHAMLILAVGALLIPPERILQHIEVDLGTTAGAPQSTGEAPEPGPAPTPEPRQPKPIAEHTPVPKPIIKPIKRPEKSRPVASRPVIKKIQPIKPKTTETDSTAPDTHRTKPAAETKITAEAEGISNAGSNSRSATAEESSEGTGRKVDASALQAYLAAVRARIEAAKRYPFAAEQRRMQGVVSVSFRLSFDGRLLDAPSVVKSSGFSILDRAALRAIKQAEPFPRFPGPAQDMPGEPLSVELKFMMR